MFGAAFWGKNYYGGPYWGPPSTVLNTAINPGVGTINITGWAPTLAQTTFGDTAINPLTGNIQITGPAPTLAQTANQALVPGTGNIQITGWAPTVTVASASIDLTPGTGTIRVTGWAPTLTQSGADNWGGVSSNRYWRPYQLRKEEWEKKIPPVVVQAIERVARSAKTGQAAVAELEDELGAAQHQARYARMLQALQESQFNTLKALRGQQLKQIADAERERERDDEETVLLLF